MKHFQFVYSNQNSCVVCTGFHKFGLSITFYWNKSKLNHCELSRLLRTCTLNRLPFSFSLFFLFFFVKLDGTKLNRSDGLNFNKFDRCLFFLNTQFYPTKRKFFVSTNECSQYIKGDLISEYIFNLVSSSKKCAKSLFLNFSIYV